MIKEIIKRKRDFNLKCADEANKKYRSLQESNANPHSIERWETEKRTCLFIAKVCDSILDEIDEEEQLKMIPTKKSGLYD